MLLVVSATRAAPLASITRGVGERRPVLAHCVVTNPVIPLTLGTVTCLTAARGRVIRTTTSHQVESFNAPAAKPTAESENTERHCTTGTAADRAAAGGEVVAGMGILGAVLLAQTSNPQMPCTLHMAG